MFLLWPLEGDVTMREAGAMTETCGSKHLYYWFIPLPVAGGVGVTVRGIIHQYN